MRRDLLALLGIQLPVLPTIVLGGLPGAPDWARRLERIGLDVVSSGAVEDTPETYAAAVAAVPHRPIKATGALVGARIVECEGEPPTAAYRIQVDEMVVIDAAQEVGDANDIASSVLRVVAADPSAWWIATKGLATVEPEAGARILEAVVDGVRHVRLYLAKQQFD
jgi:hypothetical protein